MNALIEKAPESPGRSQRRPGWWKAIVSIVLLALFSAGIALLMMQLAGRFEPKVESRRAGNVEAGSPPSATAEVRLIRRPRAESAIGTIRAVYEVNVASKLLARVGEMRVKAGQEVKADELLVVLDDADLKAKHRQAVAAEAAAQAKQEQARVDCDRAERLRKQQSISQQELETSATAFRTASAEWERARQAVKEAEIILGYATVRAPMGGRIVDKRVNEGDTVTPGQVLLSMYDPGRMQMVATVRDALAMRLQVGQELPARLDALGLECHARVTEIVPESQADTRSFQVKVSGPCPPNVYSGMFGRIFIPLEDEDVLVVPAEAVRRIGQLDEVLVVDGAVVRRRAIQLGRTLKEGREVLSGLRAGERVVLTGAAPIAEDRS
ncbi:Macrolide export protein MacA [Aquisphaera giovannonii]|uniref:Macrolide export protein MacA n=1 Tax=Aquisphaera giovannonii TaxID=406548 RepID=A0A5B9VYG0_9BACT|nr:efflux RND transporter periplasmic adaptor subunit [Aquisphaera giovannonii]QEH33199.1 Macrolide export protein MacA [Aquisphaera giovannonii]